MIALSIKFWIYSISDGTKWSSPETSKKSEEAILKHGENFGTPFHPNPTPPLLQNDQKNSHPKDNNIVHEEEEVEELLVDDFDGQCSRTYPDNHSKIVKWRASRNEKQKLFCEVGEDKLQASSNSSEVSSMSKSKEIPSDIRCKDWAKTDNDSRKPLKNNNSNSFDTTKSLSNQLSILSDHERDFAAKKRRLMTSSSLDHSKPSSTLTTESNSTGNTLHYARTTTSKN